METTSTSTRSATGTAIAVGVAICVAAASGCASSRRAEQMRTDRNIASTANRTLAEGGTTGAARIEARCYRGVVTLMGEATPYESARAERAVRGIPGVRRVNTLILDEGSSAVSGFTRPEKAPIAARAATAGPGQP